MSYRLHPIHSGPLQCCQHSNLPCIYIISINQSTAQSCVSLNVERCKIFNHMCEHWQAKNGPQRPRCSALSRLVVDTFTGMISELRALHRHGMMIDSGDHKIVRCGMSGKITPLASCSKNACSIQSKNSYGRFIPPMSACINWAWFMVLVLPGSVLGKRYLSRCTLGSVHYSPNALHVNPVYSWVCHIFALIFLNFCLPNIAACTMSGVERLAKTTLAASSHRCGH